MTRGAAAALACAALLAAAAPAAAQRRGEEAPAALEVIHVQGGVYLIAGAVGNIAVQVGPDGVLLVDAGAPERGEDVLAAVRELSDGPIRYILNTHAHADHTGGNAALREAGSTLAGGSVLVADAAEGAAIVAHENVLQTLSASRDTPVDAWPTDTYVTEFEDLFFNGEPIRLEHFPNAHTDGDSAVIFRRSDVIVTGDVFVTTHYPMFNPEQGGSIDGILAALNAIIDWTVPKQLQEGGTMVIPGHGRICDEADVVEYRDMVQIVRDRIADLIRRGMTLEQVKAARPTLDYDARYGTDYWTPEMFIEAVYKSLSS
ncbi:MAG TPA: MBL fold metallo-hydrolase [Gammaproteobacteria bacterium]